MPEIIEVYDPLGKLLASAKPPRRIVSLVPSQTELLAALGLKQQVVGLTKFCIHPADWRKEKRVVGGTKQLRLDHIRALQPDLILANKEENTRENVLALAREFPVWVSEVADLPQALEMIRRVGILTQRQNVAQQLGQQIITEFNALPDFAPISCLYFIWRDPWMSVGGDTFIHAMLNKAGFINLLAAQKRYPQLQVEEIKRLNPQLILLSSEPYPFKEKHIQELQEIVPTATILLADGELFSWYGSRLLKSPAYFTRLRAELKNREK